jgi:hypothetical protein
MRAAAERGTIDDVIMPHPTRRRIARAGRYKLRHIRSRFPHSTSLHTGY